MPSRLEIARYLVGLHPPGNVEIDTDAQVSDVWPAGVYVQAWIFVSKEDIESAMVDDSPIPK